MEESLLTKYLNSRTYFNKGFTYINTDNRSRNMTKNKNNPKINGGNTTNIPKSEFIKIIESYHDECCDELVTEIHDYLNDKYNNHCGYNMNPMEINIDQIRDLILDLTKQKLNLNDSTKNKSYNIVHRDTMNDEIFNDISVDLLEEDEYAKLDMETTVNLENDINLDTMTVQEVYDKYIYYGSPNYSSYIRYINKLLNKLEDEIDETIMIKLRQRFM